jgi:soluble lytic murein transglycosylase-like protein
MASRRGNGWWIGALVVVGVLVWAVPHGGGHAGAGASVAAGAGASASAASPSPSASSSPSASASGRSQNDPALFAPEVLRYAREAGVHPQLLMAILLNESYKPHDPAFQREWLSLKPTASLGIANMHEATYDATRQGRPFANRPWTDLIDDPGLAIEAAAWYLHDLADELPSRHSSAYTTDELLALGYNAGAGNMRAFAEGVAPGAQSAQYLQTFRSNWPKAAADLASPGAAASPGTVSSP